MMKREFFIFKKIVTFLLLATFPFSLVACGNTTTESEPASSKNDSMLSLTSSEIQSSIPSSSTNSATSSKNNSLWSRRMIALTFDDSPYSDTGNLLDLLKEKDVKATFFMWGKRMKEHPDIVKRAIEEGHDIGWHTYDHTLHSPTNQDKIAADFDKAQEIMNTINPDYKITLFRPVGGVVTDALTKEATLRDWRIINWSNYGFKDDKTSISAEERMQGVYETSSGPVLKNGEIILIHPYEGITETVEGIGLLIDKLKTDGYEPVTLTELLQRKKGGVAGKVYTTVF